MKIGLFSSNINIDFMKKKKIFILIAAILIISSIIVPIFLGFNAGVDFRGGVIIDVQAKDTPDVNALRKTFDNLGLKDIIIKEFDNNTVQVVISIVNFKDVADASNYIDSIKNSLSSTYTFLQSQFVGPTISKELIKGSIIAIVSALIGIFIYLWVRFNWQYGLIGILTMLHDVLVTFLFLSILQYEISVATIAAILTIIGYSINDTVVIFDQVRENIKKYVKESDNAIINRSINQVLSRSISTLLTVILVLLPIFFFAGESLKSFSFALIIGVSFGGYSSICLAAPLLTYIGNLKAKVKEKKDA